MLGYVERNTDGLAILVAQCNLDIHFPAFHVFSKYPYFALLIQYWMQRYIKIMNSENIQR